MKKLIFLLVLLTTASYGADYHSPYDPGAARNTLSNVTPSTGRAALGLGTMAVATSTDYVATSALALRLDTTNASISNNLDVAGDVGAATVNGVAPLTAAEKTQALVGSSTVDFLAQNITTKDYFVAASNDTATVVTPAFVNASFTESLDGDSVFAGSVYTAPQTGLYAVTGACRTAVTAWAPPETLVVRLAVNGITQSDTIGVGFVQATGTYQLNCAFSGVARLTTGQTLSVRIYSSINTTMDATANYNFVNIYKLASD